MSVQPAPTAQKLPDEVYTTLSGAVDSAMVQKILTTGATAVNGGVKRLHLLLHSTGGSIADGVLIYNFLRKLPVELVIYNGGSISSIAVTVYLAGKIRKVSKAASFMIHKSTMGPINSSLTVEQMQASVESLHIDDARTEEILREHLRLPEEKWKIHERGALTLTAEESVQFGLAHEVADFTPPPGSQLFNL